MNVLRKEELYEEIGFSPKERKETAIQIFHYCVDNYPLLERMFIDGMFDFALPYLEAEENLQKFKDDAE
jgi:hypothetical protein